MAPDEVRFEPLREDRGWYFVEYYPPPDGYRFASVYVVSVENKDGPIVAEAMENEVRTWLRRYPVPNMVTAFSAEGDVFSLKSVRPSDHLMAWDQYPATEATLQWRLVPNEELPDIALDRDFVKQLFASVPHRTRRELEKDAEQYERSLRIGWWLVFVWAVVVPLGVAILVWWSDFLGLVVVLYAFFKAGRLALRLTAAIQSACVLLSSRTGPARPFRARELSLKASLGATNVKSRASICSLVLIPNLARRQSTSAKQSVFEIAPRATTTGTSGTRSPSL